MEQELIITGHVCGQLGMSDINRSYILVLIAHQPHQNLKKDSMLMPETSVLSKPPNSLHQNLAPPLPLGHPPAW